jgi:DHA2 family multidrug resistance protein
MKSIYFKDWMAGWEWVSRIGLFLLLLSALVQLGMFVLTQNYMVSYLGAQPEDIWFAVMATYAGIITILPIQFRFLRYFETRSYLLFNIMAAIVLNVVCIHCQDIFLFLCIRFLQGIFAGNVIVCTLTLIFSRLHPERARPIGSAVFYGTMLSNTVLIAMVSGVLVETSDWKLTYYCLIFFQIIMLAVVLLMLKRKSHFKRYPLYQIDFAGMIVFGCTALALAYTILYGSKYYWFADSRICLSSCIAVVGIFLFFYRQHIAKRPVVHLDVFKSRNFIIGLCLLAIYYGGKDSINLIYNYAGGVLKWSAIQVITLAACNMIGMVLFLILAIRLIVAKKVSVTAFFAPGFALLGLFNLWMSFLLTPNLSFTDLIVPVFVQGAASGLLFVPIMIYVLSSAPGHTGSTGLIIAAYTRFTATLNSFAGFYNLQLYFNQYFKESFLGYVTTENPNTTEWLNSTKGVFASKGFSSDQGASLANSALAQAVNLQSQLLTNRAIFTLFAVVLLSLALLIFVISSISKIYISNKKKIEMTRRILSFTLLKAS